MSVIYDLRVYRPDGTWYTSLAGDEAAKGYTNLVFDRPLNQPGSLTFGLSGDHALIDVLDDDWLLCPRWKDPDRGVTDWHEETWYLFADWNHETQRAPGEYNATCQGILSLLSRRINAYPAAKNNYTNFGTWSVESIMKAMVTNNFTASATVANGRDRAGDMGAEAAWFRIDVEPDQNRGYIFDGKGNARVDILAGLQELALAANADFDLVKNRDANGQLLPGWTFVVYPTGRGTVKLGSDLIFGINRNNVSDATLAHTSSNAKTVAIAGGTGVEDARTIQLATGAPVGVTSRELFVDQSGESDPDNLLAEAKAAMADPENQATTTFDWTSLNIPGAMYGVNLELGDTVRGEYRGQLYSRRIRNVTFTDTQDENSIVFSTQDAA